MRYRVLDLPAGKVAAFTPLPTRAPVPSSYGLVRIVGAPGTFPVDAPNPTESLPTISAQHGVNSARPGDVSPDVFFPPLYIALADNQGPADDAGLGMRRRRLAELPVPARRFTRIPQSDSLVVAKGGRTAQPWPRAFQRFPTNASGA